MRNRHLYPENWNSEIRPRILVRDNFKRQKCKVRQNPYVLMYDGYNYTTVSKEIFDQDILRGVKGYKIHLQVAHKNHNKSDCSEDNLITYCPRCHHQHDALHKKMMRLAKQAEIDKNVKSLGQKEICYCKKNIGICDDSCEF